MVLESMVFLTALKDFLPTFNECAETAYRKRSNRLSSLLSLQSLATKATRKGEYLLLKTLNYVYISI